MSIDYINALSILVALIAVMIVGSMILKRIQSKFQNRGNLKLEEGLFIDTKRRALILDVCGKKYLYMTGPHSDHLVALEESSSAPNIIKLDSAKRA